MNVSLVWCETTIAPSTAPLRTYAEVLSPGSSLAMIRLSTYSDRLSRVLMPDTTEAKNGSPKNRVVSSGTTSAIAIVARLASERAARLGT
jgi:hypothetical protein